MEPVVGVDLGTTNSVVAVVEEGKVRVLADREGRTLQPSQVCFMASGEIAVGYAARDRRLTDPKNTVFSVKRLIGRDWGSPEVKRATERFPFEIREGPNRSPVVVARGQTYTLPEISALVLKHMKAMAEASLGRPVRRAVITVPANFNDVQRSTTKVAGRIAGLEILRIVNEPTAAALAYGYGRGKSERVAIYDFGGGTFDVTILQLRDHIFEVLATAGDTFLGGDDMDERLADQFAEAFLRIHRQDLKADRAAFERLRSAAEQVKIQLSIRPTVSVRIEELAYTESGQPMDLQLSVARETLETRVRDLIDRSFEVCQESLKLAGLKVGDLDNVILVGGSTRIPLVRQRVAEFFGREPLADINPDEVVAVGAAIQGFALAGDGSRQTGRALAMPPAMPMPMPPPLTPVPSASSESRASPTRTAAGAGPSVQLDEVTRRTPSPEPATLGGPIDPEVTDFASLLADEHDMGSGVSPMPAPPEPETDEANEGWDELLREDDPTLAPAGLAGSSSDDEPTLVPARLRQGGATLQGTAGIPGLRPRPPAVPAAPGPAPRVVPPLAAPEPDPASQFETSFADVVPTQPRVGKGPDLGVPPPRPRPAPALPDPATMPPLRQAPRQPVVPPPPIGSGRALLLDVTPQTLSVQTVQGYCDHIIPRNAAIPVEQTRMFSTTSNLQDAVVIRILQGESRRVDKNVVLGELELVGIRPAPRGEVEIAVTFEIDTDGILNVSAKDLETGRAQHTRITLFGGYSEEEVQEMTDRGKTLTLA